MIESDRIQVYELRMENHVEVYMQIFQMWGALRI